MLGTVGSRWEFPKIRSPSIALKMVGLLLSEHPHKGPPELVDTARFRVQTAEQHPNL